MSSSKIKVSRVVLTSGISLLSKYNPLYKKREALNVPEALFEQEARPPSNTPSEPRLIQALQAWEAQIPHDVRKLIQVASDTEAHNISAEVSILSAIQARSLLTPQPEVIIVGTKTTKGGAVINFLKPYIEKLFHAQVSSYLVEEIDIHHPEKLQRGLSNFLDTLIKQLSQRSQKDTLFAPIGGYKIMTAYAHVVATITGHSCAYLHETAKTLQMIPPLPLCPDNKTISDLFPLLKKVGTSCDFQSLEPEEQKKVSENPFLFDWADDVISLNALTNYFLNSPYFKEKTLPETTLSTSAQKKLKKLSTTHKDFVKNQIETLRHQILENPKNSALHHERNFPNRHPKSLKLFKGASGGKITFRCLYHTQEPQKKLMISQFWINHDTYDAEIESALKKPKTC